MIFVGPRNLLLRRRKADSSLALGMTASRRECKELNGTVHWEASLTEACDRSRRFSGGAGAPRALLPRLRPSPTSVGPSQVARNDKIRDGDNHQDTPPVRLPTSFGDTHPDDNPDYDIHQGDQEKDDPPKWLLRDVQHKESVEDRKPGPPGVLGAGFLGNSLKRQRKI